MFACSNHGSFLLQTRFQKGRFTWSASGGKGNGYLQQAIAHSQRSIESLWISLKCERRPDVSALHQPFCSHSARTSTGLTIIGKGPIVSPQLSLGCAR